MTEFKIPELGENVAGGDVTRVLVNVGDTVAPDQPVLELETDKATIEVPSNVSGTITEIRVKAGDKVRKGQVLARIESPELESQLAQERSRLQSLESELGRARISARQQNVGYEQSAELREAVRRGRRGDRQAARLRVSARRRAAPRQKCGDPALSALAAITTATPVGEKATGCCAAFRRENASWPSTSCRDSKITKR